MSKDDPNLKDRAKSIPVGDFDSINGHAVENVRRGRYRVDWTDKVYSEDEMREKIRKRKLEKRR